MAEPLQEKKPTLRQLLAKARAATERSRVLTRAITESTELERTKKLLDTYDDESSLTAMLSWCLGVSDKREHRQASRFHLSLASLHTRFTMRNHQLGYYEAAQAHAEATSQHYQASAFHKACLDNHV